MSAADSELISISTTDMVDLFESLAAEDGGKEIFLHEGKILEIDGIFYNVTLGDASSVETAVTTVARAAKGVESVSQSQEYLEATGLLTLLTELTDIINKLNALNNK